MLSNDIALLLIKKLKISKIKINVNITLSEYLIEFVIILLKYLYFIKNNYFNIL